MKKIEYKGMYITPMVGAHLVTFKNGCWLGYYIKLHGAKCAITKYINQGGKV